MKPYKLAIIGNGSTAINALDALINIYAKAPDVFLPLDISVFGEGPEKHCGRGFAYGHVGGAIGNLTESPAHGRADYSSNKGAFTAYATRLLGSPPREINRATRWLVGDFHSARYNAARERAEAIGISVTYQNDHVVDIARAENYAVIGRNGTQDGFDHVVLAVGDVLSRRFDNAVAQYPGRVFQSPYHAFEEILRTSNPQSVITAFGTRSSFLDLVNGLAAADYPGAIIGISTSGQTPWPAREGRAAYPLRFLTEAAHPQLTTVDAILTAFIKEARAAREDGHFVPERLTRETAASPTRRLRWEFDIDKELIAHDLNSRTYHDIIQAVSWDRLYRGLSSDAERARFNDVLGDFILYNCVNRVVPEDFKKFADHYYCWNFKLLQSSFGPDDINPGWSKPLSITLTSGEKLQTDYVVNCAIGPVSSQEQTETHTLLGNLARKGWLTPRAGSGFDVDPDHAIDLLGAQARPYPFTGIGLETYGRQIGVWVNKLAPRLISIPTSVPFTAQTIGSPAND